MSDVYIDHMATSAAPFRIGVVLSKTFSVFGSRLGGFFLLSFIPMIPLLAVILWAAPSATTRVGAAASGAAALGGLAGFLTFFLAILAQATTLYGAFQQMGGQPFSISESLGVGLRRILPVMGVALLTGLLTVLAFLLLVVPGIMVFCMLYVAVPVCVIEKIGVFDSLSRSAVLTKGYRWQIFGLLALVSIISLIVQLVLGLLGGPVAWGQVLTFGWQVIATSFSAVLVAVVYHDLRVAKEGMDTGNLANVFD
jgi:hypothetical protein